MTNAYSLNDPFPSGVYKRGVTFPLRYQDYPVYSWPWCWQRAKIFVPTLFLIVAAFSIAGAVAVKDWKVGAIVVALNCLPSTLCILLGPALAASIRTRGLDYRVERRLIVSALILVVALGMEIGRLIYVAEFDYLRTQMVANGFGKQPMQDRPLAFLLVNGAMSIIGLAWFSGGFAFRAYAYERRFWTEYQQKKETDLLRQQRDEADRKLTVLQAQVEPHFLYNTLASVRSLVQTDPKRAEATIDALVDHLRTSLPKLRNENGVHSSTLTEQVEICRSYLDVMRVRIGARFGYTIDVPQELCGFAFPQLMLISLVENAIKHGIEPKPGACSVRIAARQIDQRGSRCLEITVSDDGAGLREGPSEGVGLANIRAQLATRYGDRASITLKPNAQGGVVALLVIPLDKLQA